MYVNIQSSHGSCGIPCQEDYIPFRKAYFDTLPEFNVKPENDTLEKEIPITNHPF